MSEEPTVPFVAAADRLRAALDDHVERVRRSGPDASDDELAPTAATLARRLLEFSLTEQELTGAAAVWPADHDQEDGDAPIDDQPAGDASEADEVTVVLRMDFTLTDRDALLEAGERARAGGSTPGADPTPDHDQDEADPVADAVFAVAHRHGWDHLAADQVPGLDAAQITAQVVTPD